MKIKYRIFALPANRIQENILGKNKTDNSFCLLERKILGNKYFDTVDGSPSHGIILPYYIYITTLDPLDDISKDLDNGLLFVSDNGMIKIITRSLVKTPGKYYKILYTHDISIKNTLSISIENMKYLTQQYANKQYFSIDYDTESKYLSFPTQKLWNTEEVSDLLDKVLVEFQNKRFITSEYIDWKKINLNYE